MEFLNNLIYCISQTTGMIPMIFRVTGFLGCNLAVFSNAWNACHCCVEGSSILNDRLEPLFNLLSGEKQ